VLKVESAKTDRLQAVAAAREFALSLNSKRSYIWQKRAPDTAAGMLAAMKVPTSVPHAGGGHRVLPKREAYIHVTT
jgi:hypothetical protein